MDEPEVKTLTHKWLEQQGYKVKPEVGVRDRLEVIMDFYGYRGNCDNLSYPFLHLPKVHLVNSDQIKSNPVIMWIEAKGDVNLSELLEGFIRTEFAVFYGGGTGILAIPHIATKKLLKYKDFLKQAEGIIKILDIETNKLHQL